MKDETRYEIKYAIYLLALGVSLTVYAHQNFATKEEVRDIKSILKTIDERVYKIHIILVPKKEK